MATALGDLIRSKRKVRGWVQTQLAQRLGVQQVTVSEWETGKSHPNDMTSVMKVLGISREEYMAAAAALVEDDPVVQTLWATSKVSAEVRDALLTLYRNAALAHQQSNDES